MSLRTSLFASAALLCASFVSGGCSSPRSARAPSYADYTYQAYQPRARTRAERPALSRPALSLTGDEVLRAQRSHAARRRSADQEASDLRDQASLSPASLEAAVGGTQAAYAQGAPSLAAAWIDTHPAIREWSAAADLATFEARFVRVADQGLLEITVTRLPGVDGPMAFAFPPGTYARAPEGPPGSQTAPPSFPEPREPADLSLLLAELCGGEGWTQPDSERRWGTWPKVQDLALLQAPVVALAPRQLWGRVRVPVACAVFDLAAPEPGQAYTLASFAPTDPTAQLLAELCRAQGDPREAQLALWLAREDLDWKTFTLREGDRGRVANFADGRPVLPRHGPGAARLLLEAGIDPRPLRFFTPALTPGEATPGEATPGEATPERDAPLTPLRGDETVLARPLAAPRRL